MSDRTDPRIDLLIYAHDGRGFGHVSRSIAVGAAVRRLNPASRVLLLTGFKMTESLIGPVPLDWIKLPAYAKNIVNGRPRAEVGATNLKNSYLVASRTRLIQSIIKEYRPRCVLVDHEPQGKRQELVPAISDANPASWVLGLRGVVGQVEDVWSQTAVKTFRSHYTGLLWYGDSRILGNSVLDRLTRTFGMAPVPVGYVSRSKELWYLMPKPDSTVYAGTVAVPWQSAADSQLLDHLYAALNAIGDQYGKWRLFLNSGHERFNRLAHCEAQLPGIDYLHALAQSKVALIYGGYNSVTDVLATGIPAVVLIRDIHDREQQEHISLLSQLDSTSMVALEPHQVSAESLQQALLRQLKAAEAPQTAIDLNGAEAAARKLFEFIESSDDKSA